MKISAVYKITNTITGDFYIGSSNDVKRRCAEHKCPSRWKQCPNNQLYKDMQKYGLDKFVFEILEEVEIEKLKEKEQQFIETLKPTYNNINANGLNVERKKESHKRALKTYRQAHRDEYLARMKDWHKANRIKHLDRMKAYRNKLCLYEGEILTLNALSARFYRQGIAHAMLAAKNYLL